MKRIHNHLNARDKQKSHDFEGDNADARAHHNGFAGLFALNTRQRHKEPLLWISRKSAPDMTCPMMLML